MQFPPPLPRPSAGFRAPLALLALCGLVLLCNGFGQENPPLRLIGVGGEPSRIAESLLAGRGYANPFGPANPTGPTGWSLPAFVGWIALVDVFFGVGRTAAGVAFLGLDIACLALAFAFITRISRVHWGESAGRLAGPLFALLLILWARRDGGGWSDKFFVMACNAALLAAHLDYSARPDRRRFGVLASLGGLVGLVNVGSHLLALGLAVSRLRRNAASLRLVAVLVAIGFMPSLIWSTRHAVVFGTLLPPKTNGPFELALNHLHSRDGVLTASVLCAAHPYMNHEAFRRMSELGEAAFVAEQGARARRQIAATPFDALRRVGARARNALIATRPGVDAIVLEVDPPPGPAERLQSAGVLARCGARDLFWTWLRLDAGMDETRSLFAATGAAGSAVLVADRARAMAFYDAFARAPLARLAGWLIAFPATLAALRLLCRRKHSCRPDRTLVLAYAFLITPYILVSHSSGYQSLVLPVQALLLSAVLCGATADIRTGSASPAIE